MLGGQSNPRRFLNFKSLQINGGRFDSARFGQWAGCNFVVISRSNARLVPNDKFKFKSFAECYWGVSTFNPLISER